MTAEWEDSPTLRKVKALLEDGEEWWVEFHAPYATYREFGTGPAVGHGRYMPPDRPPYDKDSAPIRRWVADKFGLTGKELDRATAAVRWKIFHSGTQPQPFARPATAEAASRAGELIRDNLSLEPVAKYIAERAREIIDATQTQSGELADEIQVVRRTRK